MATKDPRVFARPEEYVPDRFLGEDGARLLRHVVWSNGPERKGCGCEPEGGLLVIDAVG